MVQPRTLPPPVRGEWIPMTWEEFLAWSSDEGKFEWVDGKGIAHVSNSTIHGRMVWFLAELPRLYVRVFDLGEVFVENALLRLPSPLGARPSGRMPGIFVIGRADQERVREQWVEGPALLAVEALSSESAERDLVEKREEYERAGVLEYLILEARPGHDEFACLRLDADGRYQPVEPDGEGRYLSSALPGFWFVPGWLDDDPLPSPTAVLRRISPEGWRRLMDEAPFEG
jgi:Uma2 family endonuclease